MQYLYENNDYSYMGEDGGGNLAGMPKQLGGGLRIKRIIKSDGRGSQVVAKTYEYTSENGAFSSGVLENDFLYTESLSGFYQTNYGGCGLYSPPSSNTDFPLTIEKPFSMVPITISYRRIKEIDADGSYTVYNFSTPLDYGAAGSYFAAASESYIMTACGPGRASDNYFMGGSYAHHNFIYVPDPSTVMWGLLQKKEDFTAGGRLVQSSRRHYARRDVGGVWSFEEEYIPAKSLNGLSCFCNRASSGYMDNAVDWHFCRIYQRSISFPVLTSEAEYSYGQGPAAGYRADSTVYAFNPANFQYAQTTKLDHAAMRVPGTGTTLVDKYYYPVDYADGNAPTADMLKGAHRLTEVMEHRLYRNGKLVAGELNAFGIPSGLVEKEYKLALTAPLAGNAMPFNPSSFAANIQNYTLQETTGYNQCTKRKEVVQPKNSPPVSILYGYNSTLPIATIIGPVQYGAEVQTVLASCTGTLQGVAPLYLCSFSLDHQADLTIEKSCYLKKIHLEKFASQNPIFLAPHSLNDEAVDCTNSPQSLTDVVSVVPGAYWVVVDDFNGFTGSTVNLTVKEHKRTMNAFYSSFEDYTVSTSGNLGRVVSGGQTGEKCYRGPYALQLPGQLGAYVLSYWQASGATGQPWTHHQEQVSVNYGNIGGVLQVGAVGMYVDEVRFYPVGCTVSTQTYTLGRGSNDTRDANGRGTSTEYDELGRVKVVRDHSLNVVKRMEYRVVTP